VAGTFVINVDAATEKYADFLAHMTSLDVDVAPIRHHSGIVATDELLRSDWAKELLPGMRSDSSHHHGDIGSALAHLSAWRRVAEAQECQGALARSRYALIFEDDERIKASFPEALAEIVKRAAAARPPPDLINLNVLRPRGRIAARLNVSSGDLFDLLEVDQQLHPEGAALRPNAWMSAYLVSCSGALTLLEGVRQLRYGGAPYNGAVPVFDWSVSDLIAWPGPCLGGLGDECNL